MGANTLRRRFVRLAEAKRRMVRRERILVIEARECRWTWDQLAAVLHLTRQGVQARYKDLPRRLGRPL